MHRNGGKGAAHLTAEWCGVASDVQPWDLMAFILQIQCLYLSFDINLSFTFIDHDENQIMRLIMGYGA